MYIQDFINYIKAPQYLGVITAINKTGDTDATIVVEGSIVSELTVGASIRVQGATVAVDGFYTVKSFSFANNVTTIAVNETITATVTIVETMTPRLYKGVNLTLTTINAVFDNKDVSFDNANIPFGTTDSVTNNVMKLTYDKENNNLACKITGMVLTPYEEQTEQEYVTIMNKVGSTNLDEYFRGIYETCTTFFTGLSESEIDTHKEKFYVDMQNATVVDAGSFVIIPPDDQASVRVQGIQYFIDNYSMEESNKIKLLNYGESIAVTNPDGNDEIITCGRACTFTFNPTGGN